MRRLNLKFAVVGLVCLLFYPASVFAQSAKGYMRLSGMVVNAEDSSIGGSDSGVEASIDTGMGVSLSFGGKYDNGLRVEGEYTFRKADGDELTFPGGAYTLTGDIRIHSAMSNLIYDFKSNGPIVPYLGAGIGVGWEEDADGAEFAYQALAGISYATSEQVDLILGYRYFGVSDLEYEELGVSYTASVDTHNFEFGVRYSF